MEGESELEGADGNEIEGTMNRKERLRRMRPWVTRGIDIERTRS